MSGHVDEQFSGSDGDSSEDDNGLEFSVGEKVGITSSLKKLQKYECVVRSYFFIFLKLYYLLCKSLQVIFFPNMKFSIIFQMFNFSLLQVSLILCYLDSSISA